MSRGIALAVALTMIGATTPVLAHSGSGEQKLSAIGPAPNFVLTSQNRMSVALADFRGRVVAITFIYTSCPDICPLLTEKMVQVQEELGPDFGPRVAFVSITVDPERDTPEALEAYAAGHGADLSGWSFLTGAPPVVEDVARRYGVVVTSGPAGSLDHLLLTTLVDKHGVMRVQYLGFRFDQDEFLHDLRDLVREP